MKRFKTWLNRRWSEAASFDKNGVWRIRWRIVLPLILVEVIAVFMAIVIVKLMSKNAVAWEDGILTAVIVGWFAMERLIPDADRDPKLKHLNANESAEQGGGTVR